MKAIELNAEITADHVIHLTLPEDAPAGPARVIVLYETETAVQTQEPCPAGNLDPFLKTLPKNTPGRTRKEIAAQVETDRAGWDRIAQASTEQPQK